MGGTESVVISEVAQVAEEFVVAWRQGSQEEIIMDAAFTNRVVNVFSKLPADFRKQINRQERRKPAKKEILAKQIKLSQSIVHIIPQWGSDFRKIYNDSTTLQPDFDRDPLGETYKSSLRLDLRLSTDKIRHWMYNVAFHRLLGMFGMSRLGKNACTLLANVVNRFGEHNNDEVVKNLHEWVTVGKKLDVLCQKLRERILEKFGRQTQEKLDGNRNLAFIFALAEEFSERDLKKELPIKDHKLDESIDSLIARGIFAVLPEDAFRIANDAFNYLWEMIDRSLPRIMAFNEVPWAQIVAFLNTLIRQDTDVAKIESDQFPCPEAGTMQQLPEDFLIRGQAWSQLYYPDGFFEDSIVDNEERSIELSSTLVPWTHRCLWLGALIVTFKRWIEYNNVPKTFSATAVALELKSIAREMNPFNHRSEPQDGDTEMQEAPVNH
ncbi:hypothetical protein VTN00DRAFT_9640 [Thermoascus crustaceus]|uniref:uncharacterized protein n=1 Tax=Thermoascus crustaceus TaxID=5088 RepID=UPI003743B621